MNADGKGWYRIATEKAPQNYGYNGIRLEVPEHQQIPGRSLAGDAEIPNNRKRSSGPTGLS
ncbi:MAG: DUF6055 domain-containing protein [Bacteroidales bacterium]